MSAHIEDLKQQLRQLADLAQRGALPDAAYQEAKARLERQLLDAVLAGGGDAPMATAASPTASAAAEPAAKLSRTMLGGMLAFVVVVGAAGYAWVGKPGAWQVGPGASPEVAQAAGASPHQGASAPHEMSTDQINAMVEGLAAKLQADPGNAEGWAMLARTYAALGRFDASIPAYQKAATLAPNDAQIYADYADALAVTRGRNLDGEPTALITKALKLDPQNFKALYLSGTIAFEKQDFKAAAELWERASQHTPPDNPELAKQVQAALADARQRAGLPARTSNATESNAPTATADAGASQGAEVAGTVSLSKALAGQVSPDDAVFIFAKASQGPKMPLAVLRKQVKDLPARFTLTDALAMSPQMKLSGYPEVIVSARVSKSGQAMAQPGDWQGQSAPVKLGAQNIQIEITEPVR